ncbi:uncharacterized protein LOC126818428 [Patella vulgata]|uniref:uncharacterized protein LOC126818428 n=1 Tax=Patella vulgata TaxID=6465 RepID=UPI0024A7A71F|nr:uncharacterized protein LOC126818428 [Patella vulgata]
MIEDFQQDALAIRFGLVDLVEDRTVVQRYINSRHAEKVPFIILFQEDKGEVNQTLLPTNRPTSYSIYHTCRYMGYNIVHTTGDVFVYEPYGRSESYQVCPQIEDPTSGYRCSTVYHNMTDYTVIYKHSHNIASNKTKNKKYPTIHGMKKLTQFNWNDVLKKSLWASNLQFALNSAEISSVYMVIFIISDCSSCTRHLPTFQSLYKQVNTIAGSSFYIVNCTTDKTICNHHNITGYPTITAFRKILDQSTSHCFTHKQHTTDVRLDYHGPIQIKSVMEWYSSISMEIVKDMKFKPLQKMKEDVRLVAVIVPRNSSYLPIAPTRSNKKYYYGIECYRAICNQLISVVSCYSIYSIDIPNTQYQHNNNNNNNNNNYIVTQIRLERRDGIKADIMRLGESVYTTIQDETSQLHKLHKPHRYNLRQNQKCEENHGMCSEFITSYVRDHIRLPVTHLTSVLFHTNNNPYKDNDLPIVIALVEPKHLEVNSTFLKILEDIGYELYNILYL